MNKLVKIVDNKYVQIEEYKNPNICFDTSEYSDSENYCTLRETFDPFEIFYENQELKSKLELYENGVYFSSEVDEKDKQIDVLKKKYENAVADYETTMFEKEQLNSLVNSCQEEIRQLKKQLENYKKLGFKHLQDKNNNLETQQKEFIKYLNSYIDLLNDKPDMLEETQKDILEEILQKYRSITGVSDEKK